MLRQRPAPLLDMTSDRRVLLAILSAFCLMAGLSAWDLMTDLGEGTTPSHVVVEGAVFAIGFLGAAYVTRLLLDAARQVRQTAAELASMSHALQRTEADARRWQSEARDLMRGLSEAIDEQFDRWQLSTAEREVALLLLKGLSHRDVAKIRQVTEATARQQARSVYKKGGLEGRHDLAAFFLEDLMLPLATRKER